MAKILAQIEAHNIGNIRLFAGDAAELLAWVPPHSLTRIDLIHPDPWPKRRHWKRRFVQDATVAAMARTLKPAANSASSAISPIIAPGRWRICARSPDFAWTAERAADWRLPWPDYTMTRYGRKAEREGREAAYLRFRKGSAERNSPGNCESSAAKRHSADWRVRQKLTTRSAVDGIRRVEIHPRASRCPSATAPGLGQAAAGSARARSPIRGRSSCRRSGSDRGGRPNQTSSVAIFTADIAESAATDSSYL